MRKPFRDRTAAVAFIALTIAPCCVEPRPHQDPGQVTNAAPGTVALGEPCQGFESCAAVAGKSVGCRCTDRAKVPVCVADAEPGSTCSGSGIFAPCRPGSTCAPVAGISGPWICVALGTAGSACEFGQGGCVDEDYCDDTGHCARRKAALGEACSSFDAWSCKSPNVCDRATAVCVVPTPTGGACDAIMAGRSVCGEAAYCTLSTGERDGICQPAATDGSTCWVNEQCLSRICFQGVCGRGFPSNAWASCSL